MKTKTVFAASLLLIGAAFADATPYEYTTDVIGVMPITSDQSETIVAVPWVGDGKNGEVAVTNLVKTAGLTKGDTLLWYDTDHSEYVSWILGETQDDVSYWEAGTSSTKNNSTSTGADAPALKQGQAVIVCRKNASKATPIYVIGEVGSLSTPSITITPGYNLIAPPSTSETDLNAKTFNWSSVNAGDMIYVNTRGANNKDSLTVYTYENGEWGESKYSKETAMWSHTNVAKIPAGQGFYYYRAGSDDLTINWSNVPAVTSSAH